MPMFRLVYLTLLLLLPSLNAGAHHSAISQYDPQTLMTIKGTVTEVWFRNPHVRVYLEVTDKDGEKQLWETETYPRNILVRRGWNYHDLKPGDLIVVKGRHARNGANRLQILTISRPADGWQGVGYEMDSID